MLKGSDATAWHGIGVDRKWNTLNKFDIADTPRACILIKIHHGDHNFAFHFNNSITDTGSFIWTKSIYNTIMIHTIEKMTCEYCIAPDWFTGSTTIASKYRNQDVTIRLSTDILAE